MNATTLLNHIFPPYCFGCEKEGTYLCVVCKKKLQPHPEMCPSCHRFSPHRTVCLNCHTLGIPLAGLIIPFQYTGAIKQLLRTYKYQHAKNLASYIAQRISYCIQTHPILSSLAKKNELVITHVPMHRWKKHMVRGYNQSEILAEHVAHLLGLPHITLAKKIRHTRSQMKLSRQKRTSNISNAFTSNDRKTDKTILLIDDITTTGSTLYAVAQSIKNKNPKCTIRGLAVGRHGR